MCSCLFIEMNQTAHISLQILAISKSVETKSNWMRRNFLARPAQPYLCFSRQALRSVRSVVPSGVPLCASAPPVKGYLRAPPQTRNPLFEENRLSAELFVRCLDTTAQVSETARFSLRNREKAQQKKMERRRIPVRRGTNPAQDGVPHPALRHPVPRDARHRRPYPR
jgi:hypothetical protein